MQNNIVARDGNEGNLNCFKPSVLEKLMWSKVSGKECVFFLSKKLVKNLCQWIVSLPLFPPKVLLLQCRWVVGGSNYLIYKLLAEASATIRKLFPNSAGFYFPFLSCLIKLQKSTDLCKIGFALYLLLKGCKAWIDLLKKISLHALKWPPL